MSRYLGPKVKKLKQLNVHPTHLAIDTNRLIGGLSLVTLNKLNIKFKGFLVLYFFNYKAYLTLKQFKQPDWCFFELPDISYDDISYYSVPSEFNPKETLISAFTSILGEIGLNIQESSKVSLLALDIILDSISIIDTVSNFLIKTGIIFMPLFESFRYFSYLASSYINTIVSLKDNFFATLNSMFFRAGSFCYIARNLKCKINLSTYFRTQTEDFAQFERTLLMVESFASVIYTEGCSAPVFSESQLHVAIVEILVKENALLNYSTIQNWYHGNQSGGGGLYNFTTKRGWCLKKAILDWIQVEIGSAITWKYPSTYLLGDFSSSSFFSLSLVSDFQVTDTGNKMLHFGSFTKSRIYSKSISLNNSVYTYRSLVKVFKNARTVYNYTECNSLLLGPSTFTITIPYTVVNNNSAFINQEASISKLESDFIFFLLQRGISLKTAVTLLMYGFCKNIYSKLPLELELEVPSLILSRTGSS